MFILSIGNCTMKEVNVDENLFWRNIKLYKNIKKPGRKI